MNFSEVGILVVMCLVTGHNRHHYDWWERYRRCFDTAMIVSDDCVGLKACREPWYHGGTTQEEI